MKIEEIKEQILTNAKIEYHKSWLIYHKLKIGDEVMARFPKESGTSKQSYHGSTDCLAIIKQDDNMLLYLESTKPISHSYTKSNGRMYASEKTWWAYEMKISKVEIEAMIIKN